MSILAILGAIFLFLVMYTIFQFLFGVVGGVAGSIYTLTAKSRRGLVAKGALSVIFVLAGPLVSMFFAYPAIFEMIFKRGFWALLSTPII